MKKTSVIINVTVNNAENTYTAYYESGKKITASLEVMPKTVKTWLQAHEEPHAEVLEQETVNSMSEGIKAAETAVNENKEEKEMMVRKGNEIMDGTFTPVQETNAALAYMDIPVDKGNPVEIIKEGAEAAMFMGAAFTRLVMCLGMLIAWASSWGYEKVMAFIGAIVFWGGVVVNTVADFAIAVYVGYQEAKRIFGIVFDVTVDLLYDGINFAAPYFWTFADMAVNAWAFRSEVVKDIETQGVVA